MDEQKLFKNLPLLAKREMTKNVSAVQNNLNT